MNNRYNFPFDWKISTLDEISILITDGAHYSPSPQEEGELIANVKDMRENHIEYDTCTKIPANDFHILSRQNCAPRKDDILLSKDGTIGKVVLFCGDRDIVLLSSIAIIRLSNISSSAFVKHVLKSFLFDLQLFALKSGSALSRIVLSDIRKLTIPCPPLPQQQKIAKILTTVDNLIEQTQALIDKYTAIKQGMMADLFTRGLDITGTPETNPNYGQLRPSVDDAPELYKETELGWMPKEWSIFPAHKLCSAILDCKNRTPPETDDGYAVIKTSNIKSGQLIQETLTFTNAESYSIWTQRGEPVAGDIIITREAPFGESFIITEEMPKLCLGQRMMLYRPNTMAADPDFLYWSTRADYIQRRLLELAGGSTVGHVRVGDIRDLAFKLTSLNEQKAIARTLTIQHQNLEVEKRYLNKLQKQKIGLMQDLLTGKVPVSA